MTGTALGSVEVRGLVVAMAVADAITKSAPVTLGRTTGAGDGLVTVFATGRAAAVELAVEVGTAVASGRGALVAASVIGRPDRGLQPERWLGGRGDGQRTETTKGRSRDDG